MTSASTSFLSPARSALTAFDSTISTPLSSASPMSSAHGSPQPGKTTPSTNDANTANVTAKPQLAVKPVAPAPARAAAQSLERAGVSSAAASKAPQSPAAASSPMESATVRPPMSITSKEWVIPPRPKPGRKPATDTPPTKRKAQNREAQRAFRERRAARVGELQEKLDEQKAEHEGVMRESRTKIRSLETEVQVLRSRCQMLESLLEKEKTRNQAWVIKEQQTNSSSASISPTLAPVRTGSASGMSRSNCINPRQTTAIPSPSPRKRPHRNRSLRGSTSSSLSSASGHHSSAMPFSISQIISPPDDEADLTCGSCDPGGPCLCEEDVLAATEALACNRCTLGRKCECLEDTLHALDDSMPSGILKRSHSPSSTLLAPGDKKPRFDMVGSSITEVDFTHTFSHSETTGPSSTSVTPSSANNGNNINRTPLPSMQLRQKHAFPQQQAPRYEIPMKDKCGFCSDGTYCVCADSMPGVTMTGSVALPAGTVVAQQQTPPPSETDSALINNGVPIPMEVTATGAIKLTSLRALRQQREATLSAIEDAAPSLPSIRESMCGPGGPGSCAQCLSDPVSGLFCRSLAANFERQGGNSDSNGNSSGDDSGNGGCCGGGGGAGGGCCKDRDAVRNNGVGGIITPTTLELKPQPSRAAAMVLANKEAKQSIGLSCADAYKTLASHRHFDEATEEIGTWLPMLRAVPRHDDHEHAHKQDQRVRHHPLEVEAASIMSVLKGFDVRFGKSV